MSGGIRVALLSASFVFIQLAQCGHQRSLVVDHNRGIFLKDGQPFRFVGGEMHYFRVPRAYWKDRLYKIKMAGLNTVSFYIEWSGHEPEPNVYNFQDMYDLRAFLDEIKQQGLLAVVRPGPYICAERDNGGLPYWLLRDFPRMVYRTRDRAFIATVSRWFFKLLPILKQYLYRNGGPIFAVQVENEYGHYDKCDRVYMEQLLSIMQKLMGKDDVVYFRTNSPDPKKYACDRVRDILVTGNIAYTYRASIALQEVKRANQRPAPGVIAEYYTGWMDYWGHTHNFMPRNGILRTFDDIMKQNGSVIFYMFVGGTNFGFTSGKTTGLPLTTSYDYGAPVTEDGEMRSIYYDIRHRTTRYLGHTPKGDMPRNSTKLNIGAVRLGNYIYLEDAMDHFRKKGWLHRKQSVNALTFEQMSHDYGFLMYRTTVNVATSGTARLHLADLDDRAYVRAGGRLFVFYEHAVRNSGKKNSDTIPVKRGDKLSILVENMGREDFGHSNHDVKGLTKASLAGVRLFQWTIEAVPINKNRDISEILRIVRPQGSGTAPGFFHGTFTLNKGQQPADTFLDPSGWVKGFAFINGFNLGRYWPVAGPQVRLYVPGVYLKPHPEQNQLLLFETEGAPPNRTVKLVDKPLVDKFISFPRP